MENPLLKQLAGTLTHYFDGNQTERSSYPALEETVVYGINKDND